VESYFRKYKHSKRRERGVIRGGEGGRGEEEEHVEVSVQGNVTYVVLVIIVNVGSNRVEKQQHGIVYN
jgi:hypothetical protein